MPTKPLAALLLLGLAGTAHAEIGLGRYWGQPTHDTTLVRLEVAAESAVTNVSSSWLWNPRGDALLSNDGDAHSRGLEGRVLFGMSNVYIGLELGVAQITSAPALRDNTVRAQPMQAFKSTPGALGESSGSSVTMAAPIGAQITAGPVLLGFEALVGWRRMMLENYDGGPNVDGFVPLFEARARAGVWITPTVSLALIAGKGVVVNDSHSLCLSLSVSRLPFDGEQR
jgi:hypothetical protein